MKQSDLQERQYVRVRPSLGEGFDFGQIVDLLPGERLRMRWVLNPRRGAIVDARDVISVGALGEGAMLERIDEWLRQHSRKSTPSLKPGHEVALATALEYWLDLRRDGCNAQIGDFEVFFTGALNCVQQIIEGAPRS